MRQVMLWTGVFVMAVGVCALIAAEGPAGQEEAKQVQDVEKMGAARARAQTAVIALGKAVDQNASGFAKFANEISGLYNKTAAILDRAIQLENAKGEARNDALLNDLNSARRSAGDMWNDYSARLKPAADAKYNEAYQIFHQSVNQCMSIAGQLDGAWLRGGMDPAVLMTVYATVERTARQTEAAAREAVADLEFQVKPWTEDLKKAEDLAAKVGG